MCNTELANGYLLSDEVYVKLDVFGSPMVHRIMSHVNRRDVVAERDRRRGNLVEQFGEQLAKPGTLGDGIGDGAVLRLGTRPRNRGLPLG